VAFKSGSFRKKCLKKRSKKLLSFYATVSLIPIPENNFTFKQRENCR
jgi:hypothetical protein